MNLEQIKQHLRDEIKENQRILALLEAKPVESEPIVIKEKPKSNRGKSKVSRLPTCKVCGEKGHNARSHKGKRSPAATITEPRGVRSEPLVNRTIRCIDCGEPVSVPMKVHQETCEAFKKEQASWVGLNVKRA